MSVRMKYILDDHIHNKTNELMSLDIEFAVDYLIKDGSFHIDDVLTLTDYLRGNGYNRDKLQRVIGLLDSLLDINDTIQCKNKVIQRRIDQILTKLDKDLL